MGILVPICICAVLPISIVLIFYLSQMNSDNKRAQILIKAIENNNGIDADKLADALKKPEKKKTPLELLNLRLLRGCIFSLIGIALMIIGIVCYNSLGSLDVDSANVPLVFGGISFAVGLSYLIVYSVTRKQIDKK